MKYQVFVESAVLGQGLASMGDDLLLGGWLGSFKNKPVAIVWMNKGKINMCDIKEFIDVRFKENMIRIDGHNFEQAVADKASGYLTAGGAMIAAEKMGVKYVVSAGIGGIGPDGSICSDLVQLCEGKVRLVATAFKDVVPSRETITYLQERGVEIYSLENWYDNGFLFKKDKTQEALVDNNFSLGDELPDSCRLLFNPIKEEKRFNNKNLYNKVLETATEKAAKDGHFHIQFNRAISDESMGISDLLQASALFANIRLALTLCGVEYESIWK